MNELEHKASIFGIIFKLSNNLQVLGDEFDKNITIKQWLFIVGVSKLHESPTISEVANFIGYSRQNAKRIAAVLQEKGYIKIQKDKKDARALRIQLTPACTEYFKKRNESEIEYLEKVFAGFNAELTRNVLRGLVLLDKNIEILLSPEEHVFTEGEMK